MTSFEGTFLHGAWPVLVGHRGNPARHPDNSLAGVMSGLEAVGAVEVDVRLTRDGHLILSHDPQLAGMSVATRDSYDLLDIEPRPCLVDDLTALPGRIDYEIKNLPGEEGFDPHGLAALIAASRGRATDLLTSFYWPDVDRVRSRHHQSLTGLVVGKGGSVDDALSHAVAQGHRSISAHESLLTTDVCAEADRQEVAVMAWTVNRADRARELSGMGVAAIISDDPLLIRNALRE